MCRADPSRTLYLEAKKNRQHGLTSHGGQGEPMPKRFGKTARHAIVGLLSERDGYTCQWKECGKLFTETDQRERKITIDHTDGDEKNNDPRNLRLMHRSCNAKAWHQLAKLAAGLGVGREREGSKMSVRDAAMPNVNDGFAPNKNYEVEPIFRKFVFGVVKARRGEDYLRPRNLVADGAELVGANTTTCYKYLARLTAPMFGCLEVESNAHGVRVLQFRELGDYDLSVEGLDEKYPWLGKRYADDMRKARSEA